ncbi:MAG: type II-A CRISPR-associated protein Csn2 [Candidatus Cloacimonetes bacterium]|nr:type II-A CRISPR-associated protein Csn2 [Candidatus Cloacimonadota bacterium]
MKLKHYEWEHEITIGDGQTSIIAIEDPDIFRQYVKDLFLQISGFDGPFVLSDGISEKNIKDSMVFITNPLSIEAEDRRIKTKLASMLKDLIQSEDMLQDEMMLRNAFEFFKAKIQENLPYKITFADYDAGSLVKFLDFSVETEFESDMEKLLEYLNLMNDICQIGCFVFINLLSFFNHEDLITFFSECQSLKHSLILIENHNPDNNFLTAKHIVIDRDKCELF